MKKGTDKLLDCRHEEQIENLIDLFVLNDSLVLYDFFCLFVLLNLILLGRESDFGL